MEHIYTAERMSFKDIHISIQDRYISHHRDDYEAGYYTDAEWSEILDEAEQEAFDIIENRKWEYMLMEIIDWHDVEFYDLYWNIVNLFPNAYTDEVDSFAKQVNPLFTKQCRPVLYTC